MRLAVVAAAFLQVVGWSGAPAQTPGLSSAVTQLSANEVLFEVGVVGRVRTPAEFVAVGASYRAGGQTAEEARQSGQAAEERLLAVAREFGASRYEGNHFGIAPFGNETMIVRNRDGAPQANGGSPFLAMSTLPLRIEDVARFQDLRRALEAAGVTNVTGPIWMLRDDREPRRAARADALARARAEADQFASSQGMRVVRLLRYSEAPDNPAMMAMRLTGRSATGQVETNVSAQAGFALAPR